MAEAAVKGENFEVLKKTWAKNQQGEKVLVERMRKIRKWFFEQDGGWYVQCKYGSKVLALGKGGNAVFVKALDEVEAALQALYAAAVGGELDEAVEYTVRKKKLNT